MMKFKYINTQNIEVEKLIEYSNHQAEQDREDEKFMILTPETLLALCLEYRDIDLVVDIFEDTKKYMGGIIQIHDGQLKYLKTHEFRELVVEDMREYWDYVWEYVVNELLVDKEEAANEQDTKVV